MSKHVTLNYEKHVLDVIRALEEDTGLRFGYSFDFITKKFKIVPVNSYKIDNRFILKSNKPLTLRELRKLSERAFEKYQFYTNYVKKTQYKPKNYYYIQIGNIIYGELTPTRGMIQKKSDASYMLFHILKAELHNYRMGHSWNVIKLVQVKNGKKKILKQYKTPRQALKDLE
jgi:hypothetical protein